MCGVRSLSSTGQKYKMMNGQPFPSYLYHSVKLRTSIQLTYLKTNFVVVVVLTLDSILNCDFFFLGTWDRELEF